jgi:hypothetical protein
MLGADTSPRGSTKQNAESTTGRIGDDVQRIRQMRTFVSFDHLVRGSLADILLAVAPKTGERR